MTKVRYISSGSIIDLFKFCKVTCFDYYGLYKKKRLQKRRMSEVNRKAMDPLTHFAPLKVEHNPGATNKHA